MDDEERNRFRGGGFEPNGCGCLLALLWILGMMIAVVVSWEQFHSVGYATIHGLLSWIWAAYRFLFPA